MSKFQIFGYSEREYQIPINYFNSQTGKIHTDICVLTVDDMINGYEGEFNEHEFIFALSELCLSDILALKEGESIAFQENRDIPKHGTCSIFRTR